MPEFLSAVDIGNRALQHVGAEFMDPTQGFTENSKRAQQVSAVYDALRRAELRRNGWRFAIKKTALRAIDSNTMLLVPSLFATATAYFANSIVADQYNKLWRSLIPNNSFAPGDPGTSYAWEPYFGPLSVSLYDSSQAYFAGELVYTMAGDGSYNVYYSNVNANAVHPALPNQWAANTTYFTNQVVQAFPAWLPGTTYSQGQGITIILGGNVSTYASLINSNLNNIPLNTPAAWALMPTLTLQSQAVPIFGTTVVTPPQSSPVNEWTIGGTYSTGTFVMFNAAMWLSIANNNIGNLPNAAGSTFWVAVTGGTFAMSMVDLNFDNNPLTTAKAFWSPIVPYIAGQQVIGSDGLLYVAVINNTGNNPVIDSGTNWVVTGRALWATGFPQGNGNSQWTQIGGHAFPMGVGLKTIPLGYPLNSGPVFGLNGPTTANRNIYRLPAGYLGPAMQDPKAGSVSFLGAPSGLMYRDWLIEGDYITTQDASSIVFRFVADLTDVTRMDDMFREGLAARIAVAVCEPLTQSAAKIQSIRLSYKEYMGEARLRNAIEIGAEEPPEDDYLSARY